MLLLTCQSLERVCEMISNKLEAAASKRDAQRMENVWNPNGDGDCFFACIFGAFFMILVPDPEEIFAADRGVWQALGSKHIRWSLQIGLILILDEHHPLHANRCVLLQRWLLRHPFIITAFTF